MWIKGLKISMLSSSLSLRRRFNHMRSSPLAVFLSVVATACLLILIAPWIGLGRDYDFILYRLVGLSRRVALTGLALLAVATIAITAVVKFWKSEAHSTGGWSRSLMAARSVFALQAGTSNDRAISAVVTAIGTITFAVLLSKCLAEFRLHLDQHWWQAMVDANLDWGTPLFSFGATALANFGIQVPLNGYFLPFEGLAHLFPIEMRIPATIVLCFAWTVILFWAIGGLFGLRHAYRSVFAAMVGLIVTIPHGLDRLIWIFPPNYFTHQFILASWWGEAPILLLTTVILFLFVGRCRGQTGNLLASAGFSIGAFAAILGYPVGGIFFIPLLALYCLGFFLTCETRTEFIWKTGLSVALTLFMLAARVPQFLMNLYAFTFGSYLFEFSADGVETLGLLRASFLAYSHIDDLRGLFISLVSFAGIGIAALKGQGSMRRIAIAALLCEGGIVITTVTNAFVWRIPLAGAYAELVHAPLWGSFAVLALILLLVMLDDYLINLLRFEATLIPQTIRHVTETWLSHAIKHRVWIYCVLALVAVVHIWSTAPAQSHFSTYPPKEPASVEYLRREIGILPGAPFRGRAMTWVPAELAGLNDRAHFDAIVANHYRVTFGNDHFVDLPPFNIPQLNEYGHWTSPITFSFFRTFLGKYGEQFGRAWFLFSKFDLKIARLVGVKMVITDGPAIPGGTLVLESKAGDTPLYIFRLERVNLGQYSPVNTFQASTAEKAVAIIGAPSFDPERDVVVEEDVRLLLVPATLASVTVESGPTLVVRSKSPGQSLLVLPFEFSHCLRLKTQNGSARLMPVNLQQTGLLFEGEVQAEIIYRFGLFGDAYCRGSDIARADRLDLKSLFKPTAR